MSEPGEELENESSSVWSSKRFYLIAFSYTTGPMIPRLASPWMVKTGIGILLLLPIHLILIFIVTVPCVFMELALGQYSSKGLVKIWDLCPILRGIGFCSFGTFIIYQMYNVFLTNANLLLAVLTIGSETAWKSCNRSWNSINCFTISTNFTQRYECNQQFTEEICEKMNWESSIVQFYLYRVLNINNKHNAINYELLLFALATMTIIFLANYSGPKSTEKFLMFLVVIPTLQVAILFLTPLLDFRGYSALVYLFTENKPERLKDINIWISMIKLVSSDSGLGFGGYITLGTRQAFRNPILFRSILISFLIFSFTTIYSITIQDYLATSMTQHFMRKEEFLSLEGELKMPEASFFLTYSSRFWICMWYSNTYMLGLRSLICMMCITTEIIYNSFPDLRKRHTLIVFTSCCVIYFGVLIFSTQGGYYVYKILDSIIVEIGLVFINTVKVIGVVYFYGVTHFLNDLHFMLGIRLTLHWKIFYIINPFLFGMVLLRNLKIYYDGERTQPFVWLDILQHVFLWCPAAVILMYCLYFLGKNIAKKNYRFTEPTKDWGPKDPMLRKSREMFTAHSLTKEYVYRQARFGTQHY